MASKLDPCKDCELQFVGRNKAAQCSFCENNYCLKCSKLKTSVFNELGKDDGIFFSCNHCRIAMPSMSKVLARLQSLEERVDKMDKGVPSECNMDKIREVIRLDKEEEHDREERKLNIVIQSLPESKKSTLEERKDADKREVENIINETLQLDVEFENVIRLGKNDESRVKPRPLRFTVSDFDTKRKVLNGSKLLKNHEKYSTIYITPDLTANQRKVAFDLREEKRRREKGGERNLAIRKGRIVTLNPPQDASQSNEDHTYTDVRSRKKQSGRSSKGSPPRAGGGSPPGGGGRSIFH